MESTEKTALFELLSLLRETEAIVSEIDSEVLPKKRLKEIRDQKDRINARLASLDQ